MAQAKLQSPGIMMFESSVTPAAETVAITNGVATVGFATRGPVNEVVRVESSSDFANIFGKPVDNQHWSHILASSVLAQDSVLYFMRIADAEFAERATCAVGNLDIKGAQAIIKENGDVDSYFTAKYTTEPTTGAFLKIVLDSENGVLIPMQASSSWKSKTNILHVSMATVMHELVNYCNATYTFTLENAKQIVVDAKDTIKGSLTSISVSIVDASGSALTVTDSPTKQSVRDESNISSLNFLDKYHFNIKGKNVGSGMNDVQVVKKSAINSVTGKDTWTITVMEENGNVLETYAGIEPANFLKTIDEKFTYITIEDEAAGNVEPGIAWADGTYVLGKGQLLSDKSYVDTTALAMASAPQAYYIVEGKDGHPKTDDGEEDLDAIVDLYIAAIGNPAWRNCDENTFSIFATPSCGETLVQNAAIELCKERGDSIYLIDVPQQYCEMGKSGVEQIVEWSNQNSAFQDSQAAVYYGWFAQTDPYDTAVNINCPASIYIAPKMIALDSAMGEYFPPAGVQNGIITASDYIYSPDNEDRDLMLNEDKHNVVNPIVYSNTRGILCMGQKTTDRTTSPLNRVGIRRMTNAIKRALRIRLQALLFQPNNAFSRARARNYCDDILSNLMSKGCIQGYSINVVSGTGANRNDLSVYLNFRPYGLIEFIYVYVNISDAGVEVGETASA